MRPIVPGLPEAVEQIGGIALELTERPDVVGEVEHHFLIKFALNLMIHDDAGAINRCGGCP